MRGMGRDAAGAVGGGGAGRKGLLIPVGSPLNSASQVSPLVGSLLTSHAQPGGIGRPFSLFP